MPKKLPYVQIKGIYRPIINVEFCFPSEENLIFKGIIDSGAFYSLFPAWIARFLGHNIAKGKIYNFQIGGQKVKANLHKVPILIEQEKFLWDIYFSHDIDAWDFGVLGHEPFFEHFKVTFDYPQKTIILESLRKQG